MPGLSKSKVMAGLQCTKQLWWKVHEPEAPELVPDVRLQAVFDRGHEVGEAACRHLPGGVFIDRDAGGIRGALEDTRRAIAQGAPRIYEAAFSADGVFAAVDILERDGTAWNLVEVKSSCSVKDPYIPDAALQWHVLEQAGLDVARVEIMTLNRACVFPDLSDLFVRHDVTARARAARAQVLAALPQLRAALAGPLPDVEVGEHCATPYPCPFASRCWPEPPAHPILSLYGRRTARALEAQGCETIHDITEEAELSAVQHRQVRAVQAGTLVCEAGLGDALAALPEPRGYLDFETVGPAIPRWPGCRPYDAVPAQFVVYAEDGDGEPRLREWLAEGVGDPRAACARHLVEACRGPAVLLAWYASFERRCVRHLMEAVPELSQELEDVHDRIEDLLPVVREHVYHPDFGGSFSLKSVLPALVPELSYEGLAIQGGDEASRALEDLVVRGEDLPAGEGARLRQALAEYCRLDTWGLVRLHRRLAELAGGA